MRFFIAGRLPGMNELREAAGWTAPGKGKRWNRYNQMKRDHMSDIILQIQACKIVKPTGLVWFSFEHVETNAKRDPDNVNAGARKLILDAMVKAGILAGDGQKYIAGFRWAFVTVDRDPTHAGTFVTMDEE
jgi:hypothetical protein